MLKAVAAASQELAALQFCSYLMESGNAAGRYSYQCALEAYLLFQAGLLAVLGNWHRFFYSISAACSDVYAELPFSKRLEWEFCLSFGQY